MQEKERIPAFFLLLSITGVTVALIALALSCTSLGLARQLEAILSKDSPEPCSTTPSLEDASNTTAGLIPSVSDPDLDSDRNSDSSCSSDSPSPSSITSYLVVLQEKETPGAAALSVLDSNCDLIYTTVIHTCLISESERELLTAGLTVTTFHEAMELVRDFCE